MSSIFNIFACCQAPDQTLQQQQQLQGDTRSRKSTSSTSNSTSASSIPGESDKPDQHKKEEVPASCSQNKDDQATSSSSSSSSILSPATASESTTASASIDSHDVHDGVSSAVAAAAAPVLTMSAIPEEHTMSTTEVTRAPTPPVDHNTTHKQPTTTMSSKELLLVQDDDDNDDKEFEDRGVEKVFSSESVSSNNYFISAKMFVCKSHSESQHGIERCDTLASEVSANLHFPEEMLSREASRASDYGDSRNTSLYQNFSTPASRNTSTYNAPTGMRRENFGVSIPNIAIPTPTPSGKRSTPTNFLGTPVQRGRSANSSPANPIERVKRSQAAGDELNRNDSPTAAMSGGRTPTHEQVSEAYGRRIDLLKSCLTKEFEHCEELLQSEDDLPMFKPLVRWLVDHYRTLNHPTLYRVCVKIAWKTLEYFFGEYENNDFKKLRHKILDLTEELADSMSSLNPSVRNANKYLESPEYTIEANREYFIAVGKLIVSIVVDIARVISRQIPSNLRVSDLDFRVTRALREADFDLDDVFVLPVKMSFSSIAKRSKLVTFATEEDP